MSMFQKRVEKRIREAQENGDFDNLAGSGKPLDLSSWEKVPEEMRLAFTILKNAGFKPPELELKKEIGQIEELLAGDLEESEKYRQIKKLNFLITKLNETRTGPMNLEKNQKYYEKIVNRTTVASSKKILIK